MRTQGENIVKILDQHDARTDTGIPTQTGSPVEFLVIGIQDGDQGRAILKSKVGLADVVGGKEIFSTGAHESGGIPKIDPQTYGTLIAGLGHRGLGDQQSKSKN